MLESSSTVVFRAVKTAGQDAAVSQGDREGFLETQKFE